MMLSQFFFGKSLLADVAALRRGAAWQIVCKARGGFIRVEPDSDGWGLIEVSQNRFNVIDAHQLGVRECGGVYAG